MRRITAHVAVAVIVGGLLSPVATAVTATSASAATYGAETTVVGGGRGLTGPASRASLTGRMRVDAAPDGSVLATDTSQVLRVRPDADTVTVVPGSNTGKQITDAAAAGSAVVFADATGVHRAAADGTTTLLLARSDVDAADVGADGVVWAATTHDVVRILPDGTVLPVTTANSTFGHVLDLTVTPNGSTAYVLDDGVGRYGVYSVTASGVGARVAGNLQPEYGLPGTGMETGVEAIRASTESVKALTTDGTTITLAAAYHHRVMRFAVGGVLTQMVSGGCSQDITTRGTELVAYCENLGEAASLHRLSSSGADLGRILGEDSDATWSPDGVRASDAYTDTIRGAAGLPDGRIVFTTQHGLVREVGTDGLLHTRATLAPIASRGKVAIGADGTAYVVTDAGGVVEVPASGPAVPLSLDADATDVEVQSDGTLVIADARGHRLLRVPTDGSTPTVLTDALGTPSDIGLDGDTVLVADNGLRRVSAGGAVSTVLSAGSPTTAASSPAGVWTNGFQPLPSSLYVLPPDGGLVPFRADHAPTAQVQAVADGSLVLSGGTSVRLVTDPGLPTAPPAPALTATAGGGRILLGWDGRTSLRVVAKPGATPPTDFWDGVAISPNAVGDPNAVDSQHLVLRIGDHVLQAGEQWSFAAFAVASAPDDYYGHLPMWSSAGTTSASVLADNTPPGQAITPSFGATRTTIFLGWANPSDDDFGGSVVRYALGTTAPATPDDGTGIPHNSTSQYPSLYVPDPVPDQDYALSIFTVDLHGNYSRWTGVARLDTTPPAQVTDLQVTPSYNYATFSFTRPPDSDYAFARYAVAPGSATPSFQNAVHIDGSRSGASGLTMGTDYTLAIWSVDGNGNVSEPVVEHFTALLDTTPPGPVTALSATGGDYQVTASWTPPTDSDLDKLTLKLMAVPSAIPGPAVTLPKTATSYTWPHLPGGHSYTVSVTATDANGLTSDVSTANASTNADANGTPPPVDPATVTVTPRSSTSVTVSFPKPAIPDFRNISYAAVPLGQDPTTAIPVAIMTTTPNGANLTGVVTLPQPVTSYQLVLFVYDFNGNRAQSVLPQVKGAPNASELPVAPQVLSVSSPADNGLAVSWMNLDPAGTRATGWTITATSGSLTRTVTIPGAVMHADFADLAGRQNWTVSVIGSNALGSGPMVTAAPVTVADSTAPSPVTGATRTPAADTELLSWVNPTAFDFDHVVVTRFGTEADETQEVYRGSGTSARAAGLVPGRAYSFEIKAYDHLGNVAPYPVTLTTLQPALTISGPTTLVYGGAATLTGSITWNGMHPTGHVLSIQALPYGATAWTQVAVATTSSTGTVAAVVRPSVNTQYRLGFAGFDGMGGGYSTARLLTVAPTMNILANTNSVPLGGTITIATTLAPRHPGGAILLQRWVGAGWSTVAVRTLSNTSTASVIVRPPSRGTNSYRWVTPSDPAHAAGFGAPRAFRVY